jgi:hypothetical protein
MGLEALGKTNWTQWTAQFLVAAELSRRHYTVAFTLGNTPGVDLVVTHLTSGAQFLVDVKGQASRSAWLVELEGKPTIECLYYILVYTAKRREDDRFFVLSQAEARCLRDAHKRLRGGKGALDPSGRFRGFPFNAPSCFEQECWSRLPPHRTALSISN